MRLPYERLSARGRARRLRPLARTALARFGVAAARLRCVGVADTVTFRVDAAPDGGGGPAHRPGRYLLRIHEPGEAAPPEIGSELAWLAALAHDGLPVPQPVAARDGARTVRADAPGVPLGRICSLQRWVEGRAAGRPGRRHLTALGRLTARLHQQAASWRPPPGFERPRWDWHGLFRGRWICGLDAAATWDRLPARHRAAFEAVANRVRAAMDALGQGPESFGLIHADLHVENVAFCRGEARPFDFADCGHGYWLYDLATSLDHTSPPGARDALLAGYGEVRPLPPGVHEHLAAFVAGRRVDLTLWGLARPEIARGMGERWPAYLDRSRELCERFLAGGQG